MAGAGPALEPGRDYHSLANADELRVEHVNLHLDVDFQHHRLNGVVDLSVRRLRATAAVLVLDTRDLDIRGAYLVRNPGSLLPLRWALGNAVPVLGRPLRIALPDGFNADTFVVRVSYQTQPQASGLQWLTRAQTADHAEPFLYSQSEAIHARSWIPLQDSPAVRVTYEAQVRAPPGLRVLMSADNKPTLPADGIYRFAMPQAIPPYLIAIAVGKLEFRALGERSGVYAEPSVADKAAREFADTEAMLRTSEQLFGAYRWGRYDMLILPPSFPYGGMENPRLTFVTPTLLAGDRSLVGVIAHELAHSWSGNLVSNATWRDFWLNEGFTTFLERRIVEALYGEPRRAMEDVLGLESLRRDLARLPPSDQILAIDLRGRDPDDGANDVPYEKGRLFLGWLEAKFGRDALQGFLRAYFDHFAFQSITTEQFRVWLQQQLLTLRPGVVDRVELDAWLFQPGLPASAVLPTSPAFTRVDEARAQWLAGKRDAASLPAAAWSTFEWLRFLDGFAVAPSVAALAELDARWGLTAQGNAMVECSWLQLAIRAGYEPALPRLEQFLTSIGRGLLIRPLYTELMKTTAGAERARQIYARARAGYHPITVQAIDKIVRAAH